MAVVATLFGERKAPDGTPLGHEAAAGEPRASTPGCRPPKTAGHSRTPARAADRSCPPEPAVPRPGSRSLSISVFRAFLGENARPAREVGDPAWDRYWPGLLAEVDDALMWSSTGPGTVPVQDGARRGRGVARGRGGSRVTVGVQAGRRCWGWCCR